MGNLEKYIHSHYTSIFKAFFLFLAVFVPFETKGLCNKGTLINAYNKYMLL